MREVLLFHFAEADMDTYRIDLPKALSIYYHLTLAFPLKFHLHKIDFNS